MHAAIVMTAKPLNLRPADSTGTDDLCPTRQSLLGRLKDWEDDRSWREFFDTYWRLIYRVALKSGLNEAEAHDVVQETVLSVAKKMKSFRYDPDRGSFKGWLLQLTGWRITNQFKKRSGRREALATDAAAHAVPDARGDEEPDASVPPELERLWDTEWEQNIVRSALERVRARVNPKHFQIFDLYVVRQKPPKEIGRFLGVSLTEVYLAKHRVARLVQKEAARLRDRLL